jgi:GH18 family chitinase
VAKVSYARNHGLGGVMVWEIAQDHQGGQSDSLVPALKQALRTPGPSSLQRNSDKVNLTELQSGDAGVVTNQATPVHRD